MRQIYEWHNLGQANSFGDIKNQRHLEEEATLN